MKIATRIALLQIQANPADPANFMRLVVAWVTPGMREASGAKDAPVRPQPDGPLRSATSDRPRQFNQPPVADGRGDWLALNWRRGSFRLWAITTGIWAAYIVAVCAPNLFAQVYVSDVFGYEHLPVWMKLTTYVQPYRDPSVGIHSNPPGTILTPSTELTIARFGDMVADIIVPSAIVFLAMFGVRWITAVFRRDNAKPDGRSRPALPGFFAGAICATAVVGIPALAWLWLHSTPARSSEDQAIYDNCLLDRNGNTVACDALMRLLARERSAEGAMLQQAAKLRAAGFTGCEIESWAANAGFVGSELSEASGIPLNELRAGKCLSAGPAEDLHPTKR